MSPVDGTDDGVGYGVKGTSKMRAALVTNLPNYASAIVTANEVVDSISSAKAA